MRVRRRRGRVYQRELFYEQWTGCPSCGYTPTGEHDTDPTLLRMGITNDVGRRVGQGYQRDPDAAYFDHVQVITVRHHPPGTTRAQAEAYESARIAAVCPPFNVRDNPLHREQAMARRAVLDQPVTWIDVRDTATERVRRVGRLAVLWLGSVLAAAGLLAVTIVARLG